MKFICPESQNRVSFKCGSMVSTASSGGGSASSTSGIELDRCPGDGSSPCCATTGKAPNSAATSHRAKISPRHRPTNLKMNFNFIIAEQASREFSSAPMVTLGCVTNHNG